jgi:hypothetical protein
MFRDRLFTLPHNKIYSIQDLIENPEAVLIPNYQMSSFDLYGYRCARGYQYQWKPSRLQSASCEAL